MSSGLVWSHVMGYSSKWRRMAPLGGKWSNVAVESHGGAVWRVMLSGSGDFFLFF